MCPKPKHIIISGGGTGGHIFPALAIGKALKKHLPDAEILFIGAKGKMEMEKVPQAGFQIEGLWISGLRRDISAGNLLFPLKLISSMIKSWRIQKKFSPEVMIGVGGFASGPAVRVAAWRGTPILLLEQNSFPGITNRLLARKADRICVAYQGMEKFFPQDKIVMTGNPIREEIVQIGGKREAAAGFFGLDPEKITVFVVGGSQGALSINRAIEADLAVFKQLNVQLLWQTGPVFLDRALTRISAMGYPGIKALGFIREMDYAYAIADIVISRAGAITSAELAAVGKPVIFIPLPTAAENHQMKNAMAYEEKNAAIVIEDKQIKDKLPEILRDLVKDPSKRETLERNIRKLAVTHATEKICHEIMKLLNTEWN